jgi:hypothetical protein
MKRQIVFFLSVTAEKQFYPALLERIYAELYENIISSSNLSNQVDAIGLNLTTGLQITQYIPTTLKKAFFVLIISV